MGGLKWRLGDRHAIEDRRFDPPARRVVADAVDGRPEVSFTPPAQLGAFRFPHPYGTQGIRLTNASNAPAGVPPRLYPYWSSVNQHRGRANLSVFLGRTNAPPVVLTVNKATGAVNILRELPWQTTGEGCYWSDTDPDRLYFLAGNRLSYTNVTGDPGRSFPVFTLEAQYGDDLWQAHSSRDDQAHSATVRRRTDNGPYDTLGSVVFRNGKQVFIPRRGDYDECQIDKRGRWLVIQEDHHNRILDLPKGTERLIMNRSGALSHLDVGDGFMVGEDDSADHWQMCRWDLDGGDKQVLVQGAGAWGNGMGHVAVRGYALLSSNEAGDLLRVPFNGEPLTLIAPGMMSGVDYDHQLRANLDPIGEYACWVAEIGGRFDAFLVKVSGVQAGEPTVAGTYPNEDTWWTAFLDEMAALYTEASQEWNLGAFKWCARTAFDIGAGMAPEQSKAKHLRELRAALGMGGTANP